MSEDFHIVSLKRRTMVYKSSGLLPLLLISFSMEPHLCLLSWTLIEVISEQGCVWEGGFISGKRKKFGVIKHGMTWVKSSNISMEPFDGLGDFTLLRC